MHKIARTRQHTHTSACTHQCQHKFQWENCSTHLNIYRTANWFQPLWSGLQAEKLGSFHRIGKASRDLNYLKMIVIIHSIQLAVFHANYLTIALRLVRNRAVHKPTAAGKVLREKLIQQFHRLFGRNKYAKIFNGFDFTAFLFYLTSLRSSVDVLIKLTTS